MKIDPKLREELKTYIQNRLHSNKQLVVVTAPYEMGEEELSLLKSKLPFLKDAEIVQELDSDIMAGVVIKFGSKMIDLSLKSELQKLHQSIYEIA